MADKRLSELTEQDYEVARLAVEDALVKLRDDRLSLLFRNNGLVIKERDGSDSGIIRLGFEGGLRVAISALLDQDN